MKTKSTIRIRLLAIVCVTFLSAANLVQAGSFKTGQWLATSWREHNKIITSAPGAKDYLASAQFIGYVTGVADFGANIVWEPPPGVSVDQITSIVGKYVEANPDKWTEPASLLVVQALRSAFPKKDNAK